MFLREQQTFGAIGPLFSVLASSLISRGGGGRFVFRNHATR
jgi:hypothetical protein